MQFFTLDEAQWLAMTRHEDHEPLSPGVRITRRRVLEVGFAACAGVVVAGCGATERRRADRGGAASQPITTAELVARIRPEALRMVDADRPDEDAYLAELSALLGRYRPEEPWAMRPVGETGWSMNSAAYVPPIVVFDIEMQPDARIHLHDHRHYNGVLLCTQGSVRCRHFDIVPPDAGTLDVAGGEVPPEGQDFLIRATKDKTLSPGQLASLSRDRDNIHQVEAGPDGCTLVDVFTHFKPGARSYELDWDEEPLEPGGELYRVRWRS